MGCTTSKIDDLPAVTLCRDRCTFLDEAIHYRYALAEAHLAYLHSLKNIGLSLHNFFQQNTHLSNSNSTPHSPKNDPPRHPVNVVIDENNVSHSSSSSHLHFHSDSDDDDVSTSESLHHIPNQHSDFPNTLHHHQYGPFVYGDQEMLGLDGFMHLNFMRNQTMPSVTYEQLPMSTETVHMSEPVRSTSYFPYANNPNLNPNPNSYDNYSGYPNYGGAVVGPTLVASSSKQPPPPPSPPRSSPWEFLNVFESYPVLYTPSSRSKDSREVREEEGIPDLENDEDFEHHDVVVKGVREDEKRFVDEVVKAVEVNENEKGVDSESIQHQSRPSSSNEDEDDPVEYEVHMVDKKVVNEEESRGNVASFKSDSDVVKEIQVQFERASESGSEVAKMLEVGKLPHNRKHATYQVSSKMLHSIAPSSSVLALPSTSNNAAIEVADYAILDVEGDISSRPGNISSTLQKLYLWEKKLFEEVKVEEKIRVLQERKSRKLKQLDERGADSHKVDMTRKLVLSLSSKIRIAIQVVDKISEKINKLRDEELWPQLNELIQGLSRMWKSMLDCHRHQCVAIGAAKRLDDIASHKHFCDANLEATLQLEHELLNWTLSFSCWVSAQKGYVRALNNWLMKCLLYVPEETDDGIAPFSPGRIGAPPIFVICNHWSQAFERVSEKEVVDCMRDFATNVLQLWERDKLELRQKMMVNKDMERQVKNLEREDQKIQKGIHALDKRIVLVSGEENSLSLNRHVYQSETSKNSSFQVGLQRIFEAIERFTANSLKVYEELLQCIEEDRFAREPEAVS
ncbi:protein ALTERED PHOSPHATE STARVATION RESPONSE 1-like [Lycium barbarum]|uniref:protein ALTERED PHOSPHATE STARVATION RESPONSE 1-like n=1 Tax=Lycium barbarum TaxID=112863 RepID=UPI00293EB85E|nr:protein ALTERED PHOSPHATE STARVATION RESPONSE 1-like [Lycium barbarum]